MCLVVYHQFLLTCDFLSRLSSTRTVVVVILVVVIAVNKKEKELFPYWAGPTFWWRSISWRILTSQSLGPYVSWQIRRPLTALSLDQSPFLRGERELIVYVGLLYAELYTVSRDSIHFLPWALFLNFRLPPSDGRGRPSKSGHLTVTISGFGASPRIGRCLLAR